MDGRHHRFVSNLKSDSNSREKHSTYKQCKLRIGKKDITSILDVNEAGNLISEGSRMIAQKLSEMCQVLCFRHELLYIYQMHLYKEISRDS